MKNTVVKTAMSLILAASMIAPMTQTVMANAWRDEMESRVPPPPPSAGSTTSTARSSSFTPSETYKYSKIKKRITEYKETNKDVKGWLTVPGTNINEPILHSNKDNDYYLYRDWKGNNYPQINWENFRNYPASAAYTDFRTKYGETWKQTSRNTVIYGHNWTNLRTPLAIGKENNHTMFGQLPSYTDMNFAKNNPYIYYSTEENEGVWVVFAVAYCELKESFNYNSPNPSKEKYDKLLKEWKDRSMYDFDVEVDTNDRILTLSTCTRQYNMGANQRFVVVARLLREGESENGKVKVSVNKDMKAPQF